MMKRFASLSTPVKAAVAVAVAVAAAVAVAVCLSIAGIIAFPAFLSALPFASLLPVAAPRAEALPHFTHAPETVAASTTEPRAAGYAPVGTGEPAASAFDDDYAGSLEGLESPRRSSFSIVETDATAAPINDRIAPIITSRNGGMLPTLDVRGDYETQPYADDLCVWNQSSAQKGIKMGYVKDTERRRVSLS